MRVVVLILSICGCSSYYERHKLPSLYDRDYASITYTDLYTEQEWEITKFWAQEAIGTPEARTFVRQLVDSGFGFNVSEVGVVDAGFDEGILDARLTPKLRDFANSYNFSSLSGDEDDKEDQRHGTLVTNLIAGQAPAGVSSRAEIAFLSDKPVAKVTTEHLPQLINHSMGQPARSLKLPGGGSRWVYLDIRQDEERNDNIAQVVEHSILVNSAGNRFPLLPSTVIATHGNRMIVVGSVDPSGFISRFSQSSEQVTLLAPSDRYLRVIADGDLKSFGGTSGSAPLITAVIADLRSILPTLTRDEIIYLLRRTAIVSGANLAHDNSAYLVNHYLALRVAYRLADQGFANDSSLLKDSEIYNFYTESQQMLIESKTASSYRQEFVKLRLAFFLNPTDLVIRDQLAEIYRQCGYDNQALSYSQPYGKEARYKSQLRNGYAVTYFLTVEKDNFLKWLENSRQLEQAEINTMISQLEIIRLQANSRTPRIAGYDWGDALVTYIKSADTRGNQRLSDNLRQYARDTYPETLNNETLNNLINHPQ